MIKRLASSAVLTALFLLISNLVYADLYWVYIDNIGKVHAGFEAYHTEKGDVVAVAPYLDKYKPTKAELARYFIIVADLTAEEIAELLEPIETVKARRRKVTVANLKNIKQEDMVDVEILNNNIIVKPISK